MSNISTRKAELEREKERGGKNRKEKKGMRKRQIEIKKKKEEKKKYTMKSGMRETHFSPIAGDFFSQKGSTLF